MRNQRNHPFKTSALFRGGGVSPLPMFADSRGVGVSGMPTSAISSFFVKSLHWILIFSFKNIICYICNQKRLYFFVKCIPFVIWEKTLSFVLNEVCNFWKLIIHGEGGGHFGEMQTVVDKRVEGSKIVKICRHLKWMVPKLGWTPAKYIISSAADLDLIWISALLGLLYFNLLGNTFDQPSGT